MKLRAKLITSYIVIISLIFLVFYIISMPLVRNYVRNRVSDSLINEQVLVKSRLVESLAEAEDREEYLRLFAKERIAIERLGLSSSIAIFYYGKATGTLNFVQDIGISDDTLLTIAEHIDDKDTTPYSGMIDGERQMMVAFPMGNTLLQQRIFILMYTPYTAITDFTRGFTRIMFVVFGITSAAAILISLVLAERMTNPIAKLKAQAERLRKRDFSARSAVSTKDEFRELSLALNQASTELEAYDRAQKDFLDNISHELKTPLMSIQGYAEGIRDGIFEPDDNTLGIIIGESQRLKNLVGSISYLSKLESTPDFYNFSMIDAGKVIKAAIDAVSGLESARDIKIIATDLLSATIPGDGEKLAQLFINILANAVRYASSAVYVNCSLSAESYIVEISDDGPGLPPADTDKVFRRFHKGPGGNTGLGLAISLAIAKSHGGNITAGNKVSGGAIFKVTLPLGSRN